MKKLIKLINNERLNAKINASKGCDSTSLDTCSSPDYGNCALYAQDQCGKDYSTCAEGANDVCIYEDRTACVGVTGYDYCNPSDFPA